MLPLAWDGLTSYLGLRESTNLLRLVTGMLMDCVLPLFCLPLVNDDPRPVPGQSLNWLDLSGLVAAGLVVGGGVYLAKPASWWLWALVIAAGHFLFWHPPADFCQTRPGLAVGFDSIWAVYPSYESGA
ncbi:MAG: DUF2085 domain-containing protein [Firmicutes bacterium]|nr:DUF2085 domain-containing protein [Bacillota bacterium]